MLRAHDGSGSHDRLADKYTSSLSDSITDGALIYFSFNAAVPWAPMISRVMWFWFLAETSHFFIDDSTHTACSERLDDH